MGRERGGQSSPDLFSPDGFAAAIKATCRKADGRIGTAAAPAAPSPVLFSGLLFADSGADVDRSTP